MLVTDSKECPSWAFNWEPGDFVIPVPWVFTKNCTVPWQYCAAWVKPRFSAASFQENTATNKSSTNLWEVLSDFCKFQIFCTSCFCNCLLTLKLVFSKFTWFFWLFSMETMAYHEPFLSSSKLSLPNNLDATSSFILLELSPIPPWITTTPMFCCLGQLIIVLFHGNFLL